MLLIIRKHHFKTLIMKDALENKIVIGNKYGFSRNKAGQFYVVIGKALKLNQTTGRVSLEVLERKVSIYSQNLKITLHNNERTSVMSFVLFPIN